jgi:antitoxin ParD1/3/4
MTSLNVSLPESMREWIDDQVKKGGYGTASEFVREVIREAQKNKARQELEAKLLAGINSGPAIEVNKAYWDRLKKQASSRSREHADP